MKIETIQKVIFNIDELSEKSKMKAFEDYKNSNDTWELNNELFSDDIEYMLSNDFKNSTIEVQYSLSSCQGDGLNIYGLISCYDLLLYIKDQFTEKELKTLDFYFSQVGKIQFDSNRHYCYSLWNISYKQEIIDCFSCYLDGLKNVNNELIEKFASLSCDYMHDLCKKYEKDVYSFIYCEDYTMQDFEEECYANGWEFLIDGTMY